MTRYAVLLLSLCLLGLVLGLPVSQAQQTSDTTNDAEEIRALIAELQDPERRAVLLENLALLLEARQTSTTASDSLDQPQANATTEAANQPSVDQQDAPAAAQDSNAGGATSQESASTEGGSSLTDTGSQALQDNAETQGTEGEAEAAQEPIIEDTKVQEATGALLDTILARLDRFRDTTDRLAKDLGQLPDLFSWLQTQADDAEQRQRWLTMIVNLAVVLGIGYGAFSVVWLLLRRPWSRLADRQSPTWMSRLVLLAAVLLLELFPIAAFTAASYGALAVIDMRSDTRLVAVAWVNASIVLRLIMVVGRALFAPQFPKLRLLVIDNATARSLYRWLWIVAATAVYGYLALEAALMLGMPFFVREPMLRLLGFVVTLMLLLLIFRMRRSVGRLIRGSPGQSGVFSQVRKRLAQVWVLLAVVYVLGLYGVWSLSITGGFRYLMQATLLTLLVVAAAYTALYLLRLWTKRGVHLNEDTRRRLPGLEQRLNRYLPWLDLILRWTLYLLALGLILEAWGTGIYAWLTSRAGWVLITTVLEILVIIVVTILLWEGSSSWIENYLAEEDRWGRRRVRTARTRTLLTVARNALLVFLTIIAGLAILAELGVNIGPLMAGAGVLGIAVGFGAQKLVQDTITGVFILFEDLISVGDVVDVGGKAGLVERVSLRNVQLRDLAGALHTVPYSTFTTISNLTKDFSYYLFDVGVAYRENVDQIMAVLRDLGKELQADQELGAKILEPLEILGVDAFADSAVIIKARIKTRPIEQWTVGREFNRRMKHRFDELGIEIPFPHTTIYFGENRDGKAPPARLWFDRGEKPDVLPEEIPPQRSSTPSPEADSAAED